MSSEYEFRNVLTKWRSRFDNDFSKKCNWENEKINIVESDNELVKKHVKKFNEDNIDINIIINYLEKNNSDIFYNLMFKNQVLIVISNNLELIYGLFNKLKEKYSTKKILDDLLICAVDDEHIFNFRDFFSIGSSKMKVISNKNIDLSEYKNYNIVSEEEMYHNNYYIHHCNSTMKYKLENPEFIGNGFYIGRINQNQKMESKLVEDPVVELRKKEKRIELGIDKYWDKICFKQYPLIKFKNLDKLKTKSEGIVCIKSDGSEIMVKGNLSDIISTENVKDFETIFKIYEKNVFYFLENKKECKVKKKILIENNGNIKYIKKNLITKLDEDNHELVKNIKKYLCSLE